MARLHFTQQLARFTALPHVATGAARLRAGLEAAFDANPRLRGYVLDDQGRLRENVVVFIDGAAVPTAPPSTITFNPTARSTSCKPFPEAECRFCLLRYYFV